MLKLKIINTVLAATVIALSGYGLISGNNNLMPYMMFSLGLMLLVIGIVSIKEKSNLIGIASIIVSIFIFFVSVQSLFFN